MYQVSVKIRENDLPVGGDFSVITNSAEEDLGAGELPNDHIFIPANLTARSTGVNTGCAKMVGSTTCDLKVYFTTNYHFPAHPNGRIKITIPSDITLTSTTCSATVGGVLATCSGSSLTEFTVTHD